ncbi:MAG TPA: cytochrome c [Vicinamibacterales bacterium]|nr:cytochrome c [Vicinamibacterales bacterium]
MRHRIRIALLAAIATLAFQFVPVRAQAPAAAPSGDPVKGKTLYEMYTCYACHGFTGETGARVLAGSRSTNLATESAFVTFLRARANVAPPQPSTTMPNYSAATLPDAQAKDLYAFVKTFTSHAPPVDQIPVFGQILTEAQKPYKP